MPRGSVIAGRIVDEFGEPVADAMVIGAASAVGERPAPAGQRRARRRRPTTSASSGCTACRPATTTSAPTLHEHRRPMHGDDDGAAGGAAAARRPAPASGYAPTYFPGTPSPAEAQKIAVAPGRKRRASTSRSLRCASRGSAASSSTPRASRRGHDGHADAGAGGDGVRCCMGGGGAHDREGRFTLTSVAPGDYDAAGPRRDDHDVRAAATR